KPHVVHFIAVLPMQTWKASGGFPLVHPAYRRIVYLHVARDWRPVACSRSDRPVALERQLPGLGNELPAETAMRLCSTSLETRAFVDAPRGKQFTLCPQHDLAVACTSRKAYAFVD